MSDKQTDFDGFAAVAVVLAVAVADDQDDDGGGDVDRVRLDAGDAHGADADGNAHDADDVVPKQNHEVTVTFCRKLIFWKYFLIKKNGQFEWRQWQNGVNKIGQYPKT